jgi:hypothetical protein
MSGGPGRIGPSSGALIEASFRLSWGHRDALLRIGVVPTVLSFLIETMSQLVLGDAGLGMLSLLELVPFSMFSVAGYRLLLLGPAGLPAGLGVSLGRREGRFMLLTLGISLLAALVMGLPLAALLSNAHASPGMLPIVAILAALTSYGVCRLWLVFPACAVDAPMTLAESVRRTAGAGGRLWLALLATGAVSLLSALLASLLLGGLGLARAAPFATSFALAAIAYAGTALMLVPPALAFRELSGWRGPPAPPATA